jgi:signal peptidase I
MQTSLLQRYWREWRGFVLFIIIMLLFRSAIADWNQVPTGSMIPSILEGDRIVVDKLAYDLRVPFTMVRVARWASPERSDIVTFESPTDSKLLVKRVIGVPGDEVMLDHNRLTINGEQASYTVIPPTHLTGPLRTSSPHILIASETLLGKTRTVMTHRLRRSSTPSSFGPIEVPSDHYLVLGDNRDNSQDFRVIGFVHRDRILGKANTIAFSLDYENYYLPRGDRFFHDLL